MEHKLKFKRIGIVYVGGLTRRFRSVADLGRWLNSTYEWRMIGKLEPSLALGQWHKAVRSIVADWKKCDGFVVVLPPENFFFIANVIAMMLGNVGKPVAYLCVDNDQVQNDLRFRTQMINALQTVTQDISGHISTHSHVAFPLSEYLDATPRTIYGYFDFGFRLSPRAPHRTHMQPNAPRLKVLAHIQDTPGRTAHACMMSKDPGATAVPVLISSRAHDVTLRIEQALHVLTCSHPDIARAQFVWAVQKALEAGDFADLPMDMRTPRIDSPERL